MADIFDVVADATRREILQVLHDCGSARTGAGSTGLTAGSAGSSAGVAGSTAGTPGSTPGSAAGEISVSQIVGRLELSQPTVSKHLRVLRDAGLVRVREEGQHRYYSLDTTPLETVEDWLMPLLDVSKGERYAEVLGGDAREFAGAVGKVIADTSHRVSSAVEKVTARKWRRE